MLRKLFQNEGRPSPEAVQRDHGYISRTEQVDIFRNKGKDVQADTIATHFAIDVIEKRAIIPTITLAHHNLIGRAK